MTTTPDPSEDPELDDPLIDGLEKLPLAVLSDLLERVVSICRENDDRN